jgi:hypothetical protein
MENDGLLLDDVPDAVQNNKVMYYEISPNSLLTLFDIEERSCKILPNPGLSKRHRL